MSPAVRTLLLGYGHPDRGDDAAGLLVARRLRGALPAGVEVREAFGEGTLLMDSWAGFQRVLVADSVVSGAPPGTVHRLEGRRFAASEEFRSFSSHALGLREAIRLAEALDRLPPELEIVGIEGRRYDPGDPISPEVMEGIGRAAAILAEDLKGSAAARGGERGGG